MAQTEDTELRDLVIEALEKNGSLAKIRALLRANIFLAYENERNMAKQNQPLDDILKTPEGVISLSIVREFLEFCNLKNTSFVYASESRQGKDYTCHSRAALLDKFGKSSSMTTSREPVLILILKQLLNSQKMHFERGDGLGETPIGRAPDKNYRNFREDENCTYIVHDDTGSATSHSHSHSDNSSDDKNKLLLRLPLDNSDTDTSSDSARDKTCSEYIPNKNIAIDMDSDDDKKNNIILTPKTYIEETNNLGIPSDVIYEDSLTNVEPIGQLHRAKYLLDDPFNAANSSDSTSYLDFNQRNSMFSGNPTSNVTTKKIPESCDKNEPDSSNLQQVSTTNTRESLDLGIMSKSASVPSRVNIRQHADAEKGPSVSKENTNIASKRVNLTKLSEKSDNVSGEYSNDFTSSSRSNNAVFKADSPKSVGSDSIQEDLSFSVSSKNLSNESPRQLTHSTASSVSLSDVAELLESSAQNSPVSNGQGRQANLEFTKEVDKTQTKDFLNVDQEGSLKSSNSGIKLSSTKNDSDVSGSPIQSLSNISLDYHSD